MSRFYDTEPLHKYTLIYSIFPKTSHFFYEVALATSLTTQAFTQQSKQSTEFGARK